VEGIEGKVVVITGASSGIGEATAIHLAGRGARLVLGARRDGQLTELASRIRASGGDAVHVPTDVTRREDVTALVDLARREFGRLDVFFGNAGIAAISPLDELRVDDWDRMLDVNVRGMLYGIAAALPVFRAQGFGHFIATLSTSGLKIVPFQSVYAGSKNAARAILEGLRQEAGPALTGCGKSNAAGVDLAGFFRYNWSRFPRYLEVAADAVQRCTKHGDVELPVARGARSDGSSAALAARAGKCGASQAVAGIQ